MAKTKIQLSYREHEHYRFSGRLKFFIGICVVAGLVLVLRLFYLQVVHHSTYAKMSRDNRIQLEPLPPIRGAIYDRNKKILASNRQVFDLVINTDAPGNLQSLVETLSAEFAITADDIEDFYEAYFIRNPNLSYPIIIKSDITEEEVMRFSANRTKFVGATIEHDWQRRYHGGMAVSPIVGFVGRISKNDVTDENRHQYYGLDYIGKQGLERSYEDQLRGSLGYRELEVTSVGALENSLSVEPPKRGHDLQISIDNQLQSFAYFLFNEQPGALVAMDPRNGDILSLVTSPTFDNSLFVTSLDQATYNKYLETNALFNRAVGGLYPPASTIKPMFAYGGLHENLIGIKEEITCTGSYYIPNLIHRWYRPFRDWLRSGHGQTSMQRAISESCDVYFYNLAFRAKIAGMNKTMSWFRFGEKVLGELNSEVTGFLPNDAWKRRAIKAPWLPGDTINVGIGQGYFQTTILHLANATAIVANRGKIVKPRLVLRSGYERDVFLENPVRIERTVSHHERDMFKPVIEGMTQVISEYGTAKNLIGTLSIPIAAKTGTAQVVQLEKIIGRKHERQLVDHSLFIAFMPVENPTIVVAAIVENAGSGGIAAGNLVTQFLSYYLETYYVP